jgi:NAD(P)-dependent dehydrogenase (short-subunit alcohol dehydrogenase family)
MASPFLYLSYFIAQFKTFLYLAFGRLYAPQAPPPRNLTGQVAIVTGANSGIGFSIAASLAQQGATVYLACRNLSKGREALDAIISSLPSNSKENVHLQHLDVSDLNSVRDFASQWTSSPHPLQINMLVHNAGIPNAAVGAKTLDEKGLEVVYVTNFLGSFLLTHLLEPYLTSDARIVFNSSSASFAANKTLLHPRPSSAKRDLSLAAQTAYGHTKALQVLFAELLQEKFDRDTQSQRTAHAFSPGFTSTPIFGKFEYGLRTWLRDPLFAVLVVTEKRIALSAHEGAKTGVWLAVCGNEKEVEAGKFWEYMTRRTSVVDFKKGTLGEDAFGKACREVWRAWERDAGVEWEIEI